MSKDDEMFPDEDVINENENVIPEDKTEDQNPEKEDNESQIKASAELSDVHLEVKKEFDFEAFIADINSSKGWKKIEETSFHYMAARSVSGECAIVMTIMLIGDEVKVTSVYAPRAYLRRSEEKNREGFYIL